MIPMPDFLDAIHTKGWVIFPNVVPDGMVNQMLADIEEAQIICRRIQVENGVGDGTENTVHHLPSLTHQRVWTDYLDQMEVYPNLEHFLGGPVILNSFGGNLNPPSTTNYAAAVHRDIRSWTPGKLMVNTLVALDPFTEENGATWLMAGSHRKADKPSDEEFNAKAVQVTMPAGSVLVFDSRVWHRAGVNRSTSARRIVTPIFTRAFLRPEFDYWRACGGQRSERLKQLLGFNSRVPATLQEFYQPKANRFYQGD
jgi:hypothetical protein